MTANPRDAILMELAETRRTMERQRLLRELWKIDNRLAAVAEQMDAPQLPALVPCSEALLTPVASR